MVKFDPSPKEQLTESNVRYLNMKHTGEEILAYMLEDQDDQHHVYIFQAAKITTIMNPMTGNAQYMMSEWISQNLSSDEGFEIMASDILVIAEVEPQMLKEYVKFCERMSQYKKKLNSSDTEPVVSEEIGDDVGIEVLDDGDELSGDDEELFRLMSAIPYNKPTIH